MGLARGRIASLPFVGADTTAGSESELQAAVAGPRDRVDLPRTIEESSYFANVRRRAGAGDLPRQALRDLEAYLAGDGEPGRREPVWENSWVRLPLGRLSAFARQVLDQDLASDRGKPRGARRADAERFFVRQGGETLLRVPVSYLLKLALADAAGGSGYPIASTARRLMACFTNDNTSPETSSFHVVFVAGRGDDGLGPAVAREAAKRFLLTQLLVTYANEQLGLAASGQEVVVFHSPHPPVAQRRLSRTISDAFYRESSSAPASPAGSAARRSATTWCSATRPCRAAS